MISYFIHLIQKTQLTHDVYELVYKIQEPINILPGQFLLCETDVKNPRLRRAYSVSYTDKQHIHFIIKRVLDGKGGSKAICDQKIGHALQVWGPTGSFVLPDLQNLDHIVFIGTGTGFAPLYFQIKTLLEKNPLQKISFIFGVQEEQDLFYADELLSWIKKYPNFSSYFCLSKPISGSSSKYFTGRVTDYLGGHPEYISQNAIYSICGSPAMVVEVRGILKNAGISDKNVFFEQY